ncbi:MAG: carbamoyl phosphate synthase small subunit [Anaerovoracaceae bacterium]
MAKNNKRSYRPDIPAYLFLEDGTMFEGYSLGVPGTTMGEVVFSTSMTGYLETLTDPSYYGQIVVQTFPLIGNYGINEADKESSRVWLSGYIIREWCYEPSNFRSKSDLGEYLTEHRIVGIYDIDTRALTKRIREKGVMNGAITTEYPEDVDAFLKEIKAFQIKDPVAAVSDKVSTAYSVEDAACRVAIMDYGYTQNILRSLNQRGCNVMIMPHDSVPEDLKEHDFHGIVLSNGPGDPREEKQILENLKDILATDIPVMGIGLGHQLLALALGGDIKKLKYGHRGANQPVVDVGKDRVFITAQNHGYAVDGESLLPEVGKVSHYNINDGSCEGVEYKRAGTFSLQFHPDASAGPHDTQYLFDNFVDNMIAYKEGK